MNKVVKRCEVKNQISKKGTSYLAVEIELTNTFKGQIFTSMDLKQAIEILDKDNPANAIKTCEVVERVSKEGKGYYACVVTLTNDFDEVLFLPMSLTKMINILRK